MFSMKIDQYMLWYYSPMALSFSSHLTPEIILYDCMDELSAFKFAPPALKKYERQLFSKADIVFTGGHNLYKAKKVNITISIHFRAVLISNIFIEQEVL